MTGTRCVVCSLAANDVPYVTTYEPGDYPPFREWFFLCDPHAAALMAGDRRPVVPRSSRKGVIQMQERNGQSYLANLPIREEGLDGSPIRSVVVDVPRLNLRIYLYTDHMNFASVDLGGGEGMPYGDGIGEFLRDFGELHRRMAKALRAKERRETVTA